jgi:hypothetical protein
VKLQVEHLDAWGQAVEQRGDEGLVGVRIMKRLPVRVDRGEAQTRQDDRDLPDRSTESRRESFPEEAAFLDVRPHQRHVFIVCVQMSGATRILATLGPAARLTDARWPDGSSICLTATFASSRVRRIWRLRVGDWRVLLSRDQARRVIDVLAVRPRGRAYG